MQSTQNFDYVEVHDMFYSYFIKCIYVSDMQWFFFTKSDILKVMSNVLWLLKLRSESLALNKHVIDYAQINM